VTSRNQGTTHRMLIRLFQVTTRRGGGLSLWSEAKMNPIAGGKNLISLIGGLNTPCQPMVDGQISLLFNGLGTKDTN
jgi:hypothetical protein